MSLKTYDIKDVNLIIDGKVITGLGEGTPIQAEKNEDNFTTQVGAKGETTFSETHDKTGTITVSVKNTSPSYPYLVELANRRGENAVISAEIVDLNTNAVEAGGNEARVLKPADMELGNEETEREFEIIVADFTMNP